MPYRELPAGVSALRGDPPEVATAISLRDRFSRLDPSSLWPAPAAGPFEARSISTFAVCADGTRALLSTGDAAWILDTRTIVASAPISLPSSLQQCALNADGTRAAFITDNSELYKWHLGDDAGSRGEPALVWRSAGLYHSEVLELSADGRIAIACPYSSRAMIRVFDLDAITMTYSFITDADEAVALHPGGRHLVAFGDDRIGRIYGRPGRIGSIRDTGGGAISPDGTRLISNSMEDSTIVRVFELAATAEKLEARPVQTIALTGSAQRWDAKMRFSPSGQLALVSAGSDGCHLIDLAAHRSRELAMPMRRRTAILADETLALSPSVSATAMGVDHDGVGLVSCGDGDVVGVLLSTRGSPSRLVAINSLGLYGVVEASGGPIADEAKGPYERPGLLSPMLIEKAAALERDDQLRLDEVRSRREAWSRFVPGLTTDVSLRELMAINRGLLEMTGEIVARARAASNDGDTPRFGPAQVNIGALEVAARKLLALAPAARQEVFSAMIERLRRDAKVDAPAKPSRPLSTAPNKMGLELFGESGGGAPALAPSSLFSSPASSPFDEEDDFDDEPAAIEVVGDQRVARRGPLIAVTVSGALMVIMAVIYALISSGG